MSTFEQLKELVYGMMKDQLPSHLSYHSINHTKHVVNRSEFIARQEGLNENDIELLKVAALFHDIGFIYTYKDHEEQGCKLVKETLPEYGFNEREIEKICDMIMATKIPQSPKNQLENVIADADLEYLGTDDFEEVGMLLFKELKHFNPELTLDEWNKIQIQFLSNHHYHTDYCKNNRESIKNRHLEALKKQYDA